MRSLISRNVYPHNGEILIKVGVTVTQIQTTEFMGNQMLTKGDMVNTIIKVLEMVTTEVGVAEDCDDSAHYANPFKLLLWLLKLSALNTILLYSKKNFKRTCRRKWFFCHYC